MASLTQGSTTIDLDGKLLIGDTLQIAPPPDRQVEQARDGTVWTVAWSQRRRFPLRVRMTQAEYDDLEDLLLAQPVDTISYTPPQLPGQSTPTAEDDLYYAGDLTATALQGGGVGATFTLIG